MNTNDYAPVSQIDEDTNTSTPTPDIPENRERGFESVAGATFNLTNATIGAVLLSLPFVLRDVGLILGLLIIIIGGLLAYTTLCQLYTAQYNAIIRDPTVRDFADIAYYCYGKFAAICADLSIIALNYGACVSFIIVLGDLFIPVFALAFGSEHFMVKGLLGRFITTTIFTVPMVILSMPRRLSDFRIYSYISFACVFVFCIFVVSAFYTGEVASTGEINWINWDFTMFRSIGIIIFAYASHTNLYSIGNEFRRSSAHKMYNAIAGQTIISTSTFVVVSLYGYVSFLEATKGNVADNYPNDVILAIIRCIFGVSVITGFPMNVFPCRLSLDNLILEAYYFLTCRSKPQPVDVRLVKKDETLEDLSTELMPDHHSHAKQQSRYFDMTFLRYCIETVIIGASSFLLAIFFPRVEVIFSLTGSTAAAMTCIVFPCLFYIKCCQKSWCSWQVIGSIFLLMCGLAFGLIVTVSQIYALAISKK